MYVYIHFWGSSDWYCLISQLELFRSKYLCTYLRQWSSLRHFLFNFTNWYAVGVIGIWIVNISEKMMMHQIYRKMGQISATYFSILGSFKLGGYCSIYAGDEDRYNVTTLNILWNLLTRIRTFLRFLNKNQNNIELQNNNLYSMIGRNVTRQHFEDFSKMWRYTYIIYT